MVPKVWDDSWSTMHSQAFRGIGKQEMMHAIARYCRKCDGARMLDLGESHWPHGRAHLPPCRLLSVGIMAHLGRRSLLEASDFGKRLLLVELEAPGEVPSHVAARIQARPTSGLPASRGHMACSKRRLVKHRVGGNKTSSMKYL